MTGVGFWELILVFLIGLIVLGPERLPRVARQLGTWLGQARRMTRAMKRQLEDELNLQEEMSIRPRNSALPPPQPADAAQQPAEDADGSYSPARDELQDDQQQEMDDHQIYNQIDNRIDHKDEQPDDSYSPAHDADAVGSGVGETNREADERQVDTVTGTDDSRASESDDAAPPEKTT